MGKVPASAVTVYWAHGAATVAVHGALDPLTYSQALERISSAIGNRPQRLLVNLVDADDRSGAECLALIAVTQHLLPPGCVLDVCSASPAVRQILALAGWSAPDPAARPCKDLSPGSSRCPILGVPLEAARCPGPVHAQAERADLGGGVSRAAQPDPPA
jgi:anti-anti-sigma regulatory factor